MCSLYQMIKGLLYGVFWCLVSPINTSVVRSACIVEKFAPDILPRIPLFLT